MRHGGGAGCSRLGPAGPRGDDTASRSATTPSGPIGADPVQDRPSVVALLRAAHPPVLGHQLGRMDAPTDLVRILAAVKHRSAGLALKITSGQAPPIFELHDGDAIRTSRVPEPSTRRTSVSTEAEVARLSIFGRFCVTVPEGCDNHRPGENAGLMQAMIREEPFDAPLAEKEVVRVVDPSTARRPATDHRWRAPRPVPTTFHAAGSNSAASAALIASPATKGTNPRDNALDTPT